VTFGDYLGDVIAQAMTVDQYGYIYVHGVSTSQTFSPDPNANR